MSDSYRKTIRRMIAYALYYSGLLWLIAAIKLRRKAVVLMYHRVLPAEADTFSADSIVVSPATFARQMAFLRRHFRLLSTADLAQSFDAKRALPSMGCVVTFDDGWFDNFKYALPILREQEIPAVIFAATEYVGSDACFWQERLARRLFLAAQHDGAPRRLAEERLGRAIGSMDAEAQRQTIRQAISRLKDRPADEIAAFEKALEDALRSAAVAISSTADDRFMSWNEAAAVADKSRVSVESHGCSHIPLTTLSAEQVRDELQLARSQIESAVGKPVLSIAYPNGNYSDAVVGLARQAGYRLGFTTDKGCIGADDDPLRLRRVNIHESATETMPEFLCAILLIFHRLRRSQAY